MMRSLTLALRVCRRLRQPVEIGLLLGMAVAREHVQVLDRHVELVAAMVEQFQAVMRRTADLQRLQPVEAADPMLGMHHKIAFGQGADILDELVGRLAATLGCCRQPVAQQVALADDVDLRRDEAAFDRQDGDGRARHLGHLGPALDPGEPVEAVIGQHLPQPLEGTFAVGRDQRPLAGLRQLLQVGYDRVEQVGGAVGPLGGEVARRTSAQILDQRDSGRAPAEAGRRP